MEKGELRMKAELDFLNFLQQLHSPMLDEAMCFITKLGNAGVIWIAFCAVLFAYPRTRKASLAVSLALILDAVLCNLLLKPLFCRVRPCDVNAVALLIPRPSDYSFPSGHTAASFAVVAALFFFGKQKLCVSSLVLASLIAFSRMYLYVHYPTDILGGILIGWLSGAVGSQMAKSILGTTLHS